MSISVSIKIPPNLFGGLGPRLGDMTPALRRIASDLEDASQDAFEHEGPAWKPLKDSTKKARARKNTWPGKILQVSGARGLAGSVNTRIIGKKGVYIGSPLPYARVHQNGLTKKRIPARPYLIIGKKEIKLAEKHILAHLLKKAK